MKKRNLVVSLVLALALCMSMVTSAFANSTYPGSDGSVPKLESVLRDCPDSQELTVENVAYQFNTEVADGKYKLINTESLYKDLDKYVIVDTMGLKANAYEKIHIKGAIETWAPLTNKGFNRPAGEQWGAEGGMTKAAFLDAVANACPQKTVKYYWNKKTKKWTTTKPASKNYGKCTKKSDKNYGKKYYTTKTADKNAKIVVYCGYVGCGRSHEGAMLLVKNGYKNVYRYGGGISAWYDKYGYGACEGTYCK